MRSKAVIVCFILWVSSVFPIMGQTYNDVAPAQGIIHTAPSFDTSGGGVSFFDFDDDGWDDLTLTRENDTILFYKNNQGNFELLPIYLYVAGETKQAIWVDFDNDGDFDLFISIKNAPCKLYRNDGNLTLTDITLQAGLFDSAGPNYGVSFSDYNKDGFLDLYLCRYSDAISNVNPLELNAFYKNNGDGTFSNIATTLGIDDGIKNSFQAVWLDYNKDNWPDLYVINDKYDYHNSLYKNNGDGTFDDVTTQSGTGDTTASPMTNSVADFDEDGDLDIFMTNLATPDSGRLLVNNNNGTFSEMAAQYGLQNSEFTWGAAWLDAENDSDLDLIVASDINTPNPKNYLYLNTGASFFIEASQNFQSNNVASSRSVAIGDIGNDGKSDIIVSNTDGYNSFLWENSGTSTNNYIKVTLQGSTSNKMAIGSWIEVYAGNKHFSHYTFLGENYLGQSSQHHIFGLGQIGMVDSIVVTFPSGIVDKYTGLAVNQSYTFIESNQSVNPISYSGSLIFCEGDSVILDAGNYNSFLWSTGANTRFLTVYQTGNYWVDVIGQFGAVIFSDTLFVEVMDLPQVSINAQDVSCSGLSNGSIILEITNQTNNYNITWNSGLSGDSLFNLSSGSYTFEYTDNFGCYFTDSINILSPYPLNVMTQVIGYSATGPGSITTIINGGTAPYSIYLDGNTESNFIDSLLPGNYFFEVIDANGCIFDLNIEIIDYTITDISNEINEFDCQFENPVKENRLPLSCNGKINQIKLFDSTGRSIPYYFEGGTITFLSEHRGLICLMIWLDTEVKYYKLFRL